MSEGMPQCWTHTHPKARKEHRCCECKGWISVGEQYERFSGVWDGEAGTYKTCSDCCALRAKTDAAERAEGEFDGIPFGSLCEFVRDQEFLSIMVKRGASIHRSWWPMLKGAA